MNCPYSTCTRKGLDGNERRCPQCKNLLKACQHCGELSRAFANHCRRCGRTLANIGQDWQGFKGGPERVSCNQRSHGKPIAEVRDIHHFTLQDRCRSLLSCDQHLIAVSVGGRVEVIDAATRQRKAAWKAEGPITCDPCVHRGSLYLGSRQRLVSYTLGAVTSMAGLREPRWAAPINGTPIHALLAIADSLYFNVGYQDRRPQELRCLDDIGGPKPSDPRMLTASNCLSTPAGGSEPRRRIVFLSENDGRLTIHRADHPEDGPPQVTDLEVRGAPRDLKHFVPIAVLNNKVFAVFGDDSKLCALDAERGAFRSVIKEDVQGFAFNSPNEGVLLQGGAIFFLFRNSPETLTPDDRISVPPVIVDRQAVFVGMKDGRIRWYDLHNPAAIGEAHLAGQNEEVTALASFGNYVAAGGSRGTVRLFHLKGEE